MCQVLSAWIGSSFCYFFCILLTFAYYSKIQNKEITGFLLLMIKGNKTCKLAGTSYAPAAYVGTTVTFCEFVFPTVFNFSKQFRTKITLVIWLIIHSSECSRAKLSDAHNVKQYWTKLTSPKRHLTVPLKNFIFKAKAQREHKQYIRPFPLPLSW